MKPVTRVAYLRPGVDTASFRALLAQVAQSHERSLGARVTDPDQALTTERTPFTLRFAPLSAGRFDDAAAYVVEFIGAADWIGCPVDIDGVIWSPPDMPEADLGKELHRWQARRGRALQPAGLPVFLARGEFGRAEIPSARFGSLDVRWSPAASPEQFADVLRDALAAARRYHHGREQSASRLRAVFQVVAGVFLGLAAFAVVMAGLHRDWFFPRVARRVAEYRRFEGPPPTHLNPLDERLGQLAAFESDAEFHRLGAEAQAYVGERLAELRRYREWCERLLDVRPPEEARDREELYAIQSALAALGQVPEEWRDSAGHRYWSRLTDRAQALRTATDAVTDWYDADRRALERLLYFADWPDGRQIAWGEWRSRVVSVVGISPPTAAGEWSDVVMGFPEVRGTVERWHGVRDKLRALAAITDALRLTTGPAGTSPPTPEGKFADLPDAAVPDVTSAATKEYRAAVAQGRMALATLYNQLPVPESRERWLTALEQFRRAPTTPAWEARVNALQRLMSPSPVRPVDELADFLRRESFPLAAPGGRPTPDLFPAMK